MRYNFDYISSVTREETLREAAVERHRDTELTAKSFLNATVLPNFNPWVGGRCLAGVVDSCGEFVESSAWHEGKRCGAYDFDEKDVEVRHETIIYLGIFSSCWGHAITDNLKKLWFLKTEECRRLLEEGAKFVYLTVGNEKMPGYIVRLLDLAEADMSQFEHITSISRFDKIVIPDNSFIADTGERYFTKIYVETINVIKKNIANWAEKNPYGQPYPKKIYFSRKHICDGRDSGEWNVERLFVKNGYVSFAPEKLGLERQIDFLMHATHFAATEGSISHNVVFMAKDSAVTIIRKVDDVNKYQMAVNAAADVKVTYLDAHHSTRVPKNSPWTGPFYICVTQQVRSYFNLHRLQIPYFLRPSYLWYSFWNSPFCVRQIKIRRLVKKLLGIK